MIVQTLNQATCRSCAPWQAVQPHDRVRIWYFKKFVLTLGVKVSSTFWAAMLMRPPRALERAPGMDSASSTK